MGSARDMRGIADDSVRVQQRAPVAGAQKREGALKVQTFRSQAFACGRQNQTIHENTMKKLLMLTAMSCAFAAQTLPALADATGAQKQAIEETAKSVRETLKSEEGCKAMCAEMMHNEKSKKMMCEMMAKDPECVKMIKGK
jgi:hypothetical protein